MEREPLREAIRRTLADQIVSGELVSGTPIRLVATAEGMGVSVTPLRESLVQLEIDGLVRSAVGRGYMVADMVPEEVEELYPLIWTLESLALRLAVPEPATLEVLEEINARFRESGDPADASRLDREWHRTLLSRCANRTLQSFVQVLKRRAARYEVAFMREMQRVGSSESATQHEQVVQFLSDGDLESAIRVLERNWRAGPQVLLPWLRSQGGSRAEG
jgi:DNA-binding GntR family transcriptional regulator